MTGINGLPLTVHELRELLAGMEPTAYVAVSVSGERPTELIVAQEPPPRRFFLGRYVYKLETTGS